MNADRNTQHSVPTGAADPLLSRFETNELLCLGYNQGWDYQGIRNLLAARFGIPHPSCIRASMAAEIEKIFVPQPGERVM